MPIRLQDQIVLIQQQIMFFSGTVKPNTAFSGRGYEHRIKQRTSSALRRNVMLGLGLSQTIPKTHKHKCEGTYLQHWRDPDQRNIARCQKCCMLPHRDVQIAAIGQNQRPSNCRRLKRLLGQLLRLPRSIKREVSEKTDGTKQNNSNYGSHIYNSSSCAIFDSIRL